MPQTLWRPLSSGLRRSTAVAKASATNTPHSTANAIPTPSIANLLDVKNKSGSKHICPAVGKRKSIGFG